MVWSAMTTFMIDKAPFCIIVSHSWLRPFIGYRSICISNAFFRNDEAERAPEDEVKGQMEYRQDQLTKRKPNKGTITSGGDDGRDHVENIDALPVCFR